VVRGFLCAVLLLSGCVELGVVTDGTSISVGKASHGYLVDAARLPDKGEGFMTREIWLQRDNRYGTDELVELITDVARRLAPQMKGTKLVIADMSSPWYGPPASAVGATLGGAKRTRAKSATPDWSFIEKPATTIDSSALKTTPRAVSFRPRLTVTLPVWAGPNVVSSVPSAL